MKWMRAARCVLRREQIVAMSYAFYRLGIVINTPMRAIGSSRNHEVLKGEYIRSSSLELVAREINERGLKGAVAELGVYRGEFASLINAAFPDRKLFLFDTFNGFDPGQAEEEFRNSRLIKVKDEVEDFSQTSIDLVLSRMKARENCVPVPGLFPQSTAGIKDTGYVFVSLDCDLYQPLYDGLQYFYPRLVQGGYIFVHDYNNTFYQGAKKAVRQFAAEKQIAYFPLSDASGSAIFAK